MAKDRHHTAFVSPTAALPPPRWCAGVLRRLAPALLCGALVAVAQAPALAAHGGDVDIPDANFRAIVEDALGKASGDAISQAEMETLTSLGELAKGLNKGVVEVTGIEHATSLTAVYLPGNPLSAAAQAVLLGLQCGGVYVFPAQTGDCPTDPTDPADSMPSFDIPDGFRFEKFIISILGVERADDFVAEFSAAIGGDGDLVYAITPALPAGVTFDGATREITFSGTFYVGTAADDSATTTYTYTATDEDGDVASKDFVIEIRDELPSFAADASVGAQSYFVGEAIAMLVLPMAAGGTGDELTYTLSPDLPDGLAMDDMMRISGTPTTAMAATTYTLAATDLDGDAATLAFSITVAEARINVIGFAMPDQNLRGAVAAALGEYGADNVITAEDMTMLRELDASESGITDVTGLAMATGLGKLDLSDNELGEIGAGSLPASLEWLDLRRNMLTDAQGLAGLASLERLSLSSNKISDLAPLSGLTSLRLLYLSSNEIADLMPLEKLSNLSRLHLSSNRIADIVPLELLDLQELRLSDNMVVDIEPLCAQPLLWLYLNGNEIEDIAQLAELMDLERVRIDGNPLGDGACDIIAGLEGQGVRVKHDAVCDVQEPGG